MVYSDLTKGEGVMNYDDYDRNVHWTFRLYAMAC